MSNDPQQTQRASISEQTLEQRVDTLEKQVKSLNWLIVALFIIASVALAIIVKVN